MFYGWVIAGTGFMLSIIGLGSRYSFGIFLNSIEVEFGMSRAATSGIFSMNMLLCVLVSILGGWALDKYGPRKICLVMGTFTGLSLLLTSQARSPLQLLFTYSLLLALGTGAIYGVVNTTVSRWFTAKRGLAVGLTSSGGGVGAIVISPFATYLIATFDWRTAYLIMGIIAGIFFLALSLLLKKDPSEIGALPDGVVQKFESKENTADLQTSENRGLSLKEAFRTNQFWLIGIVWLLISLTLHLVIVHVVAYAVASDIAPMDAALILSIMGLANITGRLGLGRMSDAIGRKALAVICALTQSFALLWLMQAQVLWMLYAFAIAFGFLWGGIGTIITAIIGDIFGTRHLGIIMGIIAAMWALGAAVGPAMGGYLFDINGNYVTAFATGAAGLLIAAILIAMIKPLRGQK